MVHGAPVASSNATCLPEIYGKAAIYFDPMDVSDMAAKINEVLDNQELRKKLIEAGYKQSKKYSWAKMAEQTFRVYQDIYSKLREAVEEGRSIKKSFLLYPEVNILLPLPIQQMIVAAEQSGHLADTLKTIGDIYEEKTETTTKNISVLLEPLLLVIVWLGVVAVALAVILPIYSLIGGLNR